MDLQFPEWAFANTKTSLQSPAVKGGQEFYQEMYMNLMVLEDEGVPATGQEAFSKRRCIISLKT